MRTFVRRLRVAVPLIFALSFLPTHATTRAAVTTPLPVVAIPGYQVSVFAMGTTAYSNPDSIVSDGSHVYVGYQNVTAKDGSDGKYSTVVEYTLGGAVVRSFSVLGHCDGLRYNPITHQLWAMADEDGDPHLTVITPATGAEQLYSTLAAPHGGGYDDMAFSGSLQLVDASNPNTNSAGQNVYPALDAATLSHGKVQLKTVLMGNAHAVDLLTHQNVTLNLIDPDSMTFDTAGNLVLDNQGGSELIFISGVGTPDQYVTRLPIGTQVDDTVWPTSAAGRLLVADTGANAIYVLRSQTPWDTSVAYASTPNDSGVAGFVGTIDLSTGIVTPIAVGLKSPHGELFLPDTMHG